MSEEMPPMFKRLKAEQRASGMFEPVTWKVQFYQLQAEHEVLRARLAKRSADVQSKVRYMQDTYPYTAPENMLSLFTAFANQINDLVQQWEDEDAAAAQVPGDSQGPAPKVAD
jgi:hypothetical protein